jgi:uncharacterized protein YndB with AHSA1/START domain
LAVRLVRQEVVIDADVTTVYRHLTERNGLLRWIAVDAVSDARPGGEVRWVYQNGAVMSGRYTELDPPRRPVFTYGWEDGRLGLPPGASLVEIDLVERDGKTTLSLLHRDLPEESGEAHLEGWVYFLGLLRDRLMAE